MHSAFLLHNLQWKYMYSTCIFLSSTFPKRSQISKWFCKKQKNMNGLRIQLLQPCWLWSQNDNHFKWPKVVYFHAILRRVANSIEASLDNVLTSAQLYNKTSMIPSCALQWLRSWFATLYKVSEPVDRKDHFLLGKLFELLAFIFENSSLTSQKVKAKCCKRVF